MRVTVTEQRLPIEDDTVDSVRVAVHEPPRPRGPGVLLTHGAGGDLDDAPLVALADATASEGRLVVRANLPYREAGRGGPPRADRAVPGFRAIAQRVAEEFGPRRGWVVGGKSYGGRVASMAVAEGLPARGLLFYGYPLHRPGDPSQPRVGHWPEIPCPCLFLQGTRDPFADLPLLEANLTKLARRATLHVVEGGDHSLAVPKRASREDRARPAVEMASSLGPLIDGWIGMLG